MFSVPKFVFPKVKRNSYTTSRNTLLILYTTRYYILLDDQRPAVGIVAAAVLNILQFVVHLQAALARFVTELPFATRFLVVDIADSTAAVPQAAHSSNVESSSTATGRSSTFIPISFANCRRLLLVIEGRIEVDFGVM